MFTYEVSCQMSDRIAAVASHAGTMPVAPANCTPGRSVPIMHIYGDEDTLIAYDETWDWKAWDEVGTMHDIPSLIAFWRDTYNCQSSEEMQVSGGTHFVHGECQQGARVEHHRLSGTGHEWPDEVDGLSTHQVIWSFVSEFSL